MAYELSISLKRATLELEFDTLVELERKLGALDVPRIERAVAAALRGPSTTQKPAARKPAARKAAKKAPKPAAKKPASRGRAK